ncbi:purine-nucleoside phosphorylase [Azohydromonas lata]|uniref:Purine nucleoside permease n=1 Tax=Azohydromonas lata TaxID=45677 RepID=A0ABU5IGU8_9BURK|nr:purine nucleoside permease [Azohydromonas lata]MDZ5457158.1 purine nucleoside permease [Azohydromonas lata]
MQIKPLSLASISVVLALSACTAVPLQGPAPLVTAPTQPAGGLPSNVTVASMEEARLPAVIATAPVSPRPVKVLIVTLYGPEAQAWQPKLTWTQTYKVPGLSANFPTVQCTADDICLMTTDMGHSNAAASAMAIAFSNFFDLKKAYIFITGVGGINPNVGSVGSATWARYVVDFGLAHEFDAREKPDHWQVGYFGIKSPDSDTKPPLRYGTELFQVDEVLLQKALQLSRRAMLADTPEAQAYRAKYPQTSAQAAPSVIQCDTASGDTYWHGDILGSWASKWVSLLTDGKGNYCTTQQEDNAVFEGLKRGAAAGRLQMNRVAVLRTGSNFERPYPGQSALDSLNTKSGGYPAATANLYNAAWPVVSDIVKNWAQWKDGVPGL